MSSGSTSRMKSREFLSSAEGLKSRGRSSRIRTASRNGTRGSTAGSSLDSKSNLSGYPSGDPKLWEWQSVLDTVTQSAEKEEIQAEKQRIDSIPPLAEDRFQSRSVIPTLSISERAELSQLSEALDYFIVQLEQTRVASAIMQDKSHIQHLVSVATQENTLYELFFKELIRQVTEQCKERGMFLDKLRDQYSFMFQRVVNHTQGRDKFISYNSIRISLAYFLPHIISLFKHHMSNSYANIYIGLERELSQHDSLAQGLHADLAQVQKELFNVQTEAEEYKERLSKSELEAAVYKEQVQELEDERLRINEHNDRLKAEWDRQKTALQTQVDQEITFSSLLSNSNTTPTNSIMSHNTYDNRDNVCIVLWWE